MQNNYIYITKKKKSNKKNPKQKMTSRAQQHLTKKLSFNKLKDIFQ